MFGYVGSIFQQQVLWFNNPAVISNYKIHTLVEGSECRAINTVGG